MIAIIYRSVGIRKIFAGKLGSLIFSFACEFNQGREGQPSCSVFIWLIFSAFSPRCPDSEIHSPCGPQSGQASPEFGPRREKVASSFCSAKNMKQRFLCNYAAIPNPFFRAKKYPQWLENSLRAQNTGTESVAICRVVTGFSNCSGLRMIGANAETLFVFQYRLEPTAHAGRVKTQSQFSANNEDGAVKRKIKNI